MLIALGIPIIKYLTKLAMRVSSFWILKSLPNLTWKFYIISSFVHKCIQIMIPIDNSRLTAFISRVSVSSYQMNLKNSFVNYR